MIDTKRRRISKKQTERGNKKEKGRKKKIETGS